MSSHRYLDTAELVYYSSLVTVPHDMYEKLNGLSYHHHVSSERVCQVSNRGVAIGIRGLAFWAVSWLVAPVSKN